MKYKNKAKGIVGLYLHHSAIVGLHCGSQK